ncbi:MAG: response regulator [Phycisphaeraceae bacterium]|nr:response regulator [Phycisphaerales bacterium]MCB9860160.1 response regulator [Phycisphaeraceae bacterium]
MQFKRPKIEASSQRTNSAGLSHRQLDQVLNALESGKKSDSKRRVFTRWSYRNPRIEMGIKHPGGTESTVFVASRDLSCQGMSILHSSYLYPGSEVTLNLPKAGMHDVEKVVYGKIARCLHLHGRLHEIGVCFDDVIDVRSLLAYSDDDDPRYVIESIDPEKLEGCIVCLEDSALDQKLIQHYLRSTHLRIRFPEDIETAFNQVREGCQLFLVDVHLSSGENGLDAVEKVNAEMPSVPVVLLTSDVSKATRDRADKLRVAGILKKPVDATTLLRAIAEYMYARAIVKGFEQKQTVEVEDSSFHEAFVRTLAEEAQKIESMIENDDHLNAYAACLQIKASAPQAGLDDLATVAEKAANTLAATSSTSESKTDLEALVQSCKRLAAA